MTLDFILKLLSLDLYDLIDYKSSLNL